MSSPFGNPSSDSRSGGASVGTSGFDTFSSSDSDSPFGLDYTEPEIQTPRTANRVVFKSAPWIFCGLALASAIVAVIVALVVWFGIGNATELGFMIGSVIAWLLAGIVSFILVGIHKMAENRCQEQGVYLQKSSQVLMVRATLAIGVLGVIISAIEISLWVSKAVGV